MLSWAGTVHSKMTTRSSSSWSGGRLLKLLDGSDGNHHRLEASPIENIPGVSRGTVYLVFDAVLTVSSTCRSHELEIEEAKRSPGTLWL
jgi:hypothetical protein